MLLTIEPSLQPFFFFKDSLYGVSGCLTTHVSDCTLSVLPFPHVLPRQYQ